MPLLAVFLSIFKLVIQKGYKLTLPLGPVSVYYATESMLPGIDMSGVVLQLPGNIGI